MTEESTVVDSAEHHTGGAERHQFGAEVGRLLDLVVHSL